MYNDKCACSQKEVTTPPPDSIITEDFFQKNRYVINFTYDEIISKFEVFTKNTLDKLYQTKIKRTEWLQMLDEYWDEGYTSYQVHQISGYIVCFDRTTNCQNVDLLKVFTSCLSHNNTD